MHWSPPKPVQTILDYAGHISNLCTIIGALGAAVTSLLSYAQGWQPIWIWLATLGTFSILIIVGSHLQKWFGSSEENARYGWFFVSGVLITLILGGIILHWKVTFPEIRALQTESCDLEKNLADAIRPKRDPDMSAKFRIEISNADQQPWDRPATWQKFRIINNRGEGRKCIPFIKKAIKEGNAKSLFTGPLSLKVGGKGLGAKEDNEKYMPQWIPGNGETIFDLASANRDEKLTFPSQQFNSWLKEKEVSGLEPDDYVFTIGISCEGEGDVREYTDIYLRYKHDICIVIKDAVPHPRAPQ